MRRTAWLFGLLCCLAVPPASAADYPAPVQGDYVDNYVRTADANDVLYALEASWDYDPGPGLGRITAPLLAVNFADDLVNPPELGILEREIARVPKGRAVVLPFSEETRGHGSHTIAGLWKHLLAEFLAASDRRSG